MNGPAVIPEHPSTSKALWLAAATIAVLLHLGIAALAYVHLQQDAESEDLGAPGIEIGLELSSPQATPTDLPPGPEAEASVASPAVAEQVAEVKQVDLPKDTPTEAETPDQIVTAEKSDKPVEEENPDVKVNTQASEESVAQEATAAPSLPDAAETQKSVTIDAGTAESRRRMRVTWQKELVAHLDKHKKYPSSHVQKSAEIVLSFTLDRMGRVLSVGVIRGSGDEAFDEAARAMVARSNPVPPPPPLVADEGLSFTLPVVFRVGRRK
jgi:protein TonB